MKDLDTLLREDAARGLDDAGFSRRVMAALPVPRATPRWIRPALVLGSAIAGSALAVAFAPRLESPTVAFMELLATGALSPAAWVALSLAGALLLSCLVVAFDTE